MASIGGNTVPSTYPYYMGEKGKYVPKRKEVVGRDGEGLDIVAGYAAVVWSWEELTYEDYQWWTTTLLAGAPSAAFSAAQLHDHGPTLTTYTHCIVHAPTFEQFLNGVIIGVQVVIDDLRV